MPRPKEESTVRFIEFVHLHELLWNKSHPDHKDFQRRSNAWQTIATFCGYENGELAKKKWKHLTTARAGAQKIMESSNGDSSVCDYLYSSEMSFLDGIKKRKRRRSSPGFACLNMSMPIQLPTNSFIQQHQNDQPNSSNSSEKAEQATKSSKPQVQEDQETDTNEQLLSAIEAAIGSNAKQASAEEEETEGMLFGRLIGRRLDRLDARKRAKLFVDIQSLLYKYEFEE